MAKIVFKEDEEIVVPESTKKTVDNDILDESSDDEAPEAISTSKAKDNILSKVHAEKEAQAKLAAEEKEKRRQRDQHLKEQKENSKRQQKELEKKAKQEKAEKEFLAREEKRKLKQETEPEENLLPQDLLQQALIEQEEESKKRKHVTTEEFEKMIAEQEAEEALRAKKRKNTKNGRNVGEYTVKVINNRPKVEKTNKQLRNNRNNYLQRSAVPRKEAVVNISSGRDGAALVFKRKQ